jgi:mRNA interferase RelE/StbE
MPCRVLFIPAAEKQLGKLSRDAQMRIVQAIAGLANDPRPYGCRKLAGREAEHRIRIGDYRVVYTINDSAKEVVIKIIADRKEVYRRR